MNPIKSNIQEVSEIIELFVEKNGVELPERAEYQSTLASKMSAENPFCIASEELQIFGQTELILIEVDENSKDFLTKESKKANKYIQESSKGSGGFEQFEVVFIVHSISTQLRIESMDVSKIKKQIIGETGISRTKLIVRASFIGTLVSEKKEVRIESNLQSIIFFQKEICEEKEISRVYSANLYDLVQIYFQLGNLLFKNNVRFRIADKIHVDDNILKTLQEEPANFWLKNNGITIIANRDTVDFNKQKKISILCGSSEDVSVINGAQTISTAAEFFVKKEMEIEAEKQQLFEAQEKEDSKTESVIKEKINLTNAILNAAKNTLVLLRIIIKDGENSRLYDDISISLNRQKAINDADMRYMDRLTEEINVLAEAHNNKYPYFCIKKAGDKGKGYFISDFAKIVTIYYLQKPGLARSSKNRVIKDEEYWTKLRFNIEGKDVKEQFLEKYRPFIFAKYLYENIKKFFEGKEKSNNWYKYGNEFCTAYILWALNDYQNETFSDFNINESDFNKLVDENWMNTMIDEFIQLAETAFPEGIDSNTTKKDSEYYRLREFIDKSDRCAFKDQILYLRTFYLQH